MTQGLSKLVSQVNVKYVRGTESISLCLFVVVSVIPIVENEIKIYLRGESFVRFILDKCDMELCLDRSVAGKQDSS